jgi:hypothetical protein
MPSNNPYFGPAMPALAGLPAALDPWLQAQERWLESLVTVQWQWWSQCGAWQSQWLQQFGLPVAEFPTWLVWHNGSEQLA